MVPEQGISVCFSFFMQEMVGMNEDIIQFGKCITVNIFFNTAGAVLYCVQQVDMKGRGSLHVDDDIDCVFVGI